jgi:hypothetical protein
MRNNLTPSQRIKIGFWALTLTLTSMMNLIVYYNIVANFNIMEVIFLYILLAVQFTSLIEIYLIVCEESVGRSKR